MSRNRLRELAGGDPLYRRTPKRKKPRNERLWSWLGSTIPTGTIWFLYGRWSWQRRFGGWWLSWWGWMFLYSKPWRPWKPE